MKTGGKKNHDSYKIFRLRFFSREIIIIIIVVVINLDDDFGFAVSGNNNVARVYEIIVWTLSARPRPSVHSRNDAAKFGLSTYTVHICCLVFDFLLESDVSYAGQAYIVHKI